MEERWELLNSCEQQFALAKSRISVGGIAQAETSTGEVLIRIGETPYADVARFRYLDTAFAIEKVRYRGAYLRVGLFFTAHAALTISVIFGMAAGVTRLFPFVTHDFALLSSAAVSIGLNAGLSRYIFRRRRIARQRNPVAILQSTHGPAILRYDQVRLAKVCSSTRDRSWWLHVVHDKGESDLRGAEAEFYLGLILSRVWRPLVTSQELEEALKLIAQRGGASAFLQSFTSNPAGKPGPSESNCVGLMQSPKTFRVAAAIAVDECLDRRRTEAEIQSLRRTAATASEIAEIADDLLLPKMVVDSIAYLRSKFRGGRSVPDSSQKSAD